MRKAFRAPLVIEGIGLQLLLAVAFASLVTSPLLFHGYPPPREVTYGVLMSAAGGATFQACLGSPGYYQGDLAFYTDRDIYNLDYVFNIPWLPALALVLAQFTLFGVGYSLLHKRQSGGEEAERVFSFKTCFWGSHTRYLWMAFVLNLAIGFWMTLAMIGNTVMLNWY